jgi:hypothetical protein
MADQGNVFSFDAAKAQYEVLFLQEDKTLPAVKALCGGFKNSGIRGLVWKVLLGLLPSGDENNWKEIISAKRAAYVELSARHIIKQADLVAHDGDPLDDNPLMQNEDSVWTKYFAQVEIEKEIQKDLERIFPEFEFFQQPAIQEVMLRVLLVWSKLNADVSYRQGMHELLGPLLMTLVNSSFKADEAQLSHPIAVLCSADDVEADAYLLFEIMMHKMKDMFAVVGSVKSLPGQPPIDYRCRAPHSCKFKIPFGTPSAHALPLTQSTVLRGRQPAAARAARVVQNIPRYSARQRSRTLRASSKLRRRTAAVSRAPHCAKSKTVTRVSGFF